ncbi:pyridoxamine 5'-phosphate oxidase family protein [Amphritea sp. HPY]|uniref:pyridoxamine 5'-phosphate oxidase family protein n=1 Tax=Amphritea sp. HPY TaxID=3421652 RepID=UPI003D7EFDEC
MTHKGTAGESQLQQLMASEARAQRFYNKQMYDHLTNKMRGLIQSQEMVFVATADKAGNCDCTPRFGPVGFVQVLDEKTLAFPEYRGNGVYASLGNLHENPHIGLVFMDFFKSTVGLHVNGSATSYATAELPTWLATCLAEVDQEQSGYTERWVVISVDEAYIHCSKHVPLLKKKSKRMLWGSDSPEAKSEDFFVED